MGEVNERAPASIPPEQMANVFLDKIESAEAAADAIGRQRLVAEGGLRAADEGVRAAEETRRVAGAEVAAISERESSANELVARWRQAARASLELCEGYPADETLREQMRIDGRSHETAEVIADVAAVNKYVRTEENPVIVVVQQMPPFDARQPESARNVVHFIRPRTDDDPALTITRSGVEHHARLTADQLYELNPDMREYDRLNYDSDPLAQSVIGPVENVLFVGKTKDVGTLFETEEFTLDALTRNNGDPVPSVIVYGDEAVELFTRLLGDGVKGMRPALYGTMLNLGKAHKGVGMYDVETQKDNPELRRAQDAFLTDLEEHMREAVAPLPEGVKKEEHVLLSPGVQEFIGLDDNEVAACAETYVRERSRVSKAGLRDGEVTVQVGPKSTVEEAWASIWNSLDAKGFKDLAVRMREPIKVVSMVLSAERQALATAVNPAYRLNYGISQRRSMKKALKVVEEKIEQLET